MFSKITFLPLFHIPANFPSFFRTIPPLQATFLHDLRESREKHSSYLTSYQHHLALALTCVNSLFYYLTTEVLLDKAQILTPPSHYGIMGLPLGSYVECSEVGSTESLWYIMPRLISAGDRSEVDSTESLWYTPRECVHERIPVLKLTPPSHYGIPTSTTLMVATAF